MVINKKGFLKILEAIIGIVVILGFVISIIPTIQKESSRIPPDLEHTTNSIFKEVQNSPEFRQCVIKSNASCIHSYIDYLSFPVASHPWNYSVRICKINSTSSIIDCNYDPQVKGIDLYEKNKKFSEEVLPQDKDIYTKAITLTAPDVLGFDQPNIDAFSNYSLLTVYAWSKS
ncbi:hypothetical protein HYU23_02615 [Candidatus Woesearchaeota archaeon]|nr:hypothetical protein [Candidatus Woesearchaeota archaeon]